MDNEKEYKKSIDIRIDILIDIQEKNIYYLDNEISLKKENMIPEVEKEKRSQTY